MTENHRILFVEDLETDKEIAERELKKTALILFRSVWKTKRILEKR